MTMNFVRAGSRTLVGAALLAAVACSAAATSDERDGQLGQATEAVVCNPNDYAAVCLNRCQGQCTNGAAIASCMTVCIGEYCSFPTFHPDPHCAVDAWQPGLDVVTVTAVPGCETPDVMRCYKRCDLCNDPLSGNRQPCAANCFRTYCSTEKQPGCLDQERQPCQTQCGTWSGGDLYYQCYASCTEEHCGKY